MNSLSFLIIATIIVMKIFILVVLVWAANRSFGATFPAFAILDSSYNSTRESLEAPNMPPIQSQDSLPICYGFSAWTSFEQYRCKELGTSCQNIDPKTTPSPLFLASLGSGSETNSAGETVPYNSGGNSLSSLNGFKELGGSYAESCYPFDQFVATHRNENKAMVEAFEKIKTQYIKNRTEGSACLECLSKTLSDDFNLKKDSTQIGQALAQDTFDKFLFDIFLRDCNDFVEVSPDFKLNGWPSDGKAHNYDAAIGKIKETLNTGRPITTQACLDTKLTGTVTNDCKTGHEFLISGYRKSCKPDGTCRDTLKIHNSWGQDWQEEHNDGWVDAKTLYNYMSKGKNSLSWLSNTK